MSQTTVVHCADGTPLEVHWNGEGWDQFSFGLNGEHWTYPASTMDIWLDPISPARAQRAFDEVGLAIIVRPQFAGPFQYVAVPEPTPEVIGQEMMAVGKLIERFKSPLGFWQEFCEPRARQAVVDLEGHLRGEPMEVVAAAFAYGLAQTFTSITPIMLAVMPLRMTLEQRYGPEGALLADEATQGGANASQAVDGQLLQIARLARSTPAVMKTLEEEETGRRLTALRFDPAASAFIRQFDAFIEQHAGRSFGWELVLPTWGEDPEAVLAMVAAHARAGGTEEFAASSHAIREAARARVYADFAGPQLGQIQQLLQALEGLITIREDRAYWQMRLVGAVRMLLLEKGDGLVRAGRLERADDILHLCPAEFEADPTSDLRPLVSRRRAEWEHYTTLTPPPFFGAPPAAQPAVSASGHQLLGAGVSRGVATGRARVIESPDDYDRFEEGDILVCRLTTPAWTPMFGLAAAVVTETGSAFSHPAITAREYGIPAVLSVPDARRLIVDGSIITVDGETGTVTLPVPA